MLKVLQTITTNDCDHSSVAVVKRKGHHWFLTIPRQVLSEATPIAKLSTIILIKAHFFCYSPKLYFIHQVTNKKREYFGSE